MRLYCTKFHRKLYLATDFMEESLNFSIISSSTHIFFTLKDCSSLKFWSFLLSTLKSKLLSTNSSNCLGKFPEAFIYKNKIIKHCVIKYISGYIEEYILLWVSNISAQVFLKRVVASLSKRTNVVESKESITRILILYLKIE